MHPQTIHDALSAAGRAALITGAVLASQIT